MLCPGVFDDAYARAVELCEERGYTFIHPFDDIGIITGQGTVGLELLDHAVEPDVILVPVGGGGLLAGIACAVKQSRPGCRVIGVEPEGAASMKASLRAGKPMKIDAVSTFADGVAVKAPSELTYGLCAQYADEIVTVSDAEIACAILRMVEDQKIVAEGAGAVAVAAAIYGKTDLAGKKAACIVSGGNLDVNLLERVISQGLVKTGRVMEVRAILDDKPRQLRSLLDIVSDQGANILSVSHDRTSRALTPGQCLVELRLETRGGGHTDQITDAIKAAGYTR
jgi:threonine dehydratase